MTTSTAYCSAPAHSAGPARLGAYRTRGNRAVLPGETVYLDGNILVDPAARYEASGFRWVLLRRPDGSRAQLAQANTCRAVLVPDRAGRYIARLDAVTPRGRVHVIKEVRVSQDEVTPVAVAQVESSTVLSGAPIRLDGTASENPLAGGMEYEWRITAAPEGSIAMLSYAASDSPMIFPDREGRYEITLLVRNAAGIGTSDRVTVNVVTSDSLSDLTMETRRIEPAAINFGRTYSDAELSALQRAVRVKPEAVSAPAPKKKDPQRFATLIGHIRTIMRDGVENFTRQVESAHDFQQPAVSRR